MSDLEELVDEVALLEHKIRTAAEGNAILLHAAALVGQGGAGIQKAIAKQRAALERRSVADERYAVDATERQYDQLTKDLAKQRGISYAEMQEIRDQAAARTRAAAGLGSISEQTAKARKLDA